MRDRKQDTQHEMTRDPLEERERWSQDDSLAPDWRHPSPTATVSTPRPPLPSGHLLNPRTECPGELGLDSPEETQVTDRSSQFSLRAEGSMVGLGAGGAGQPTPSAHPPAAVPHLVHPTVLPGAQLWGTLFPRTCSWPRSWLPQKGSRHLPEKRKSDPEPRLSRSPPPGASTQQGSAALSLPGCCVLVLRLQDQVVYCGGRLHEGGGATNHSC